MSFSQRETENNWHCLWKTHFIILNKSSRPVFGGKLTWRNFKGLAELANLTVTKFLKFSLIPVTSPKYQNKFPFHQISEVKTGIFPKPKCFSITEILVCPQTFSHTVMCKVCNNSLKYAIRCGHICTSLDSIQYLASEVFGCAASLNSPNINLNSQYNLLAIRLAGFSANLRTRKLRLMQLEQNAYFCSSIVEKIYIIKVGERTWK